MHRDAPNDPTERIRLIPGTNRPRVRHGRRVAEALAAIAALAALAGTAGTAGAAPTPALADRLAQAGPGDRIAVIATFARPGARRRRFDGRPARPAARPAAHGGGRRRRASPPRWTARSARSGSSTPPPSPGTPDEIRAVAADPAVGRRWTSTAPCGSPTRGTDAAPTPFPDAGTRRLGPRRHPRAGRVAGVRRARRRRADRPDRHRRRPRPRRTWPARWPPGATSWPAARPRWTTTATAPTPPGRWSAGAPAAAPIGVAPGARLLVARAMGANGSGTGSALLAAAQWMTDPDGNPGTADQPAIVNNSWSASTANDTWFRPMIRRWLELGIVPVFAAGNTGPTPAASAAPPATRRRSPSARSTRRRRAALLEPRPRGLAGHRRPRPRGGHRPAEARPGRPPASASPRPSAPATSPTRAPRWPRRTSRASRRSCASSTPASAPRRSPTSCATARPTSARPAPDAAVRRRPGRRPAGARDAPSAPRPTPASPARRRPRRARAPLGYEVALSGGGVAVRTRVDGGPWSAPGADAHAVAWPCPKGRHVVEAQAIDAAGVTDPSPARHAVTIDRTAPSLRVSMVAARHRAPSSAPRVRGGAAGPVRWSFGDGETAARRPRGAPLRRGPRPPRGGDGRATRPATSASWSGASPRRRPAPCAR